MKEQPFFQGQKVVVIDESGQIEDPVKVGENYTISTQWDCPQGNTRGGYFYEILEKKNGRAYHQSLFAPVQEGFEAISFERVLETELTSVN